MIVVVVAVDVVLVVAVAVIVMIVGVVCLRACIFYVLGCWRICVA